jgi:hypothetical protein
MKVTLLLFLLQLYAWHLSVACSVVGIAAGYGLDGPGIESRWGRDFPHLSRPALKPTQPPVQWVPGLSPEVKSGRGVTLTPSPPSSAFGHERVELYLYSPYGPYGLYRASVPVQGCTIYLLQLLRYFQLSYGRHNNIHKLAGKYCVTYTALDSDYCAQTPEKTLSPWKYCTYTNGAIPLVAWN